MFTSLDIAEYLELNASNTHMKNFLIIFREPDGRTISHNEQDELNHRQNWKAWLEKWGKEGRLAGGSGLTLNGSMVKEDTTVIPDIHHAGKEIIGGFLLLKARDLNEAVSITRSCPIFEFDGYAEVREMQ